LDRPFEGEVVAYAPPEAVDDDDDDDDGGETGKVMMPELFKVFYQEDCDCEDCLEEEILEGIRVYEECPNAVDLYRNRMLSKKSSEEIRPTTTKISGTRKEKRRTAEDRDGLSKMKKSKKKHSNINKTHHMENTDDYGDNDDRSFNTQEESDRQDSDNNTANDESGSMHEAQAEVLRRREESKPAHSEEECLEEICQVSARLTQLKSARNQLERQLKENGEEERKAKARLVQLSSWVKSYS